MKKFTAFILAFVLVFSVIGCSDENRPEQGNSSATDGKIYLTDRAAAGKSLEERKEYLKNAFDHSRHNKTVLTLIPKADSPLAGNDNDYDVSGGYLYSVTEDGKHMYYKTYGDNNFPFNGKYSISNDMYNMGGYDPGDKFIIYYDGELPEDGDISAMNLITIIPEMSLAGSKAVEPEQGEKTVDIITKGLDRYLYEKPDGDYSIMSIEEAVIAALDKQNIDKAGFYKTEIKNGGVCYTNGEIYVTAKAHAQREGDYVVIRWFVRGYTAPPEINSDELFEDMFFTR